MSFLQDLRYGFRTLLKSPGLTAAALLTLALGIGATTSIFSVIYGVLLRPLPYRDPDRLVAIWQSSPQRNVARKPTSYPNLADWRDRSRSFEAMAGSATTTTTLREPGPDIVPGGVVAPGFFDLLGVRAARGRLFLPEDYKPGARGGGSAPPVVLSWAAWERRFGQDPKIIGRTLRVFGGARVVIGIMPRDYRHPALADGDRAPEFWMPLDPMTSPFGKLRQADVFTVIGRLKPGVPVSQARAELANIGVQLAEQYPQNKGFQVETVPVKDVLVGQVRRPLWLLLAAVGVLLLCACVNVANLLLARAVERHREFAIRSALGGARWRLFRQVITEGLLLSAIGGVLGIMLANFGVDWLMAAAGSLVPRSEQVQVDGAVLLFTLGVSCLTGVAFSCVPAFASSRIRINEGLQAAGRTSATAIDGRTRTLLVASEIALALVLVAGAGLLMRSFQQVLNIDLGFAPERVLTAEVSLPGAGFSPSGPDRAFMPALLDRITSLPGVQAAGAARTVPLAHDSMPMRSFDIVGQAPAAPGDPREAVVGVATAGYFRAMGIPLRRGRMFDDRDMPDKLPAAVVNEAFVRRYLPAEDPIGKTVDVGRTLSSPARQGQQHLSDGIAEVVGVVADARHADVLTPAQPQIWHSQTQRPWPAVMLAIRTSGDPTKLVSLVRSEVKALNKTVPLTNIRTAEEYYSDALAQRRVSMLLLGALAGVALVLSAVGAYGVIAYSVTQRRQEIGIRMALGAQPRDVLRMVVRQGLEMTGIGLAIGLPAALAATRLLGSLLYGVKPHDPLTFAGLVLLFIAVAFVASYLPARKAIRLDPNSALHFE